MEAVTTTISQQLSIITSSLDNLNTNMQKITADNLSIRKTLSELNQRILDTEKSLQFSSDTEHELDQRLKTVETKVSLVSTSQDRVIGMENKIQQMEQQARMCNVEVCNLQERRGENLLEIIEIMAKEIKFHIQNSDVVSIHRVPHANNKNSKPKNIIVKFTTRVLRDNFIASYRSSGGLNSTQLSLSGTPQVIYVNEHLTLNNKQLFRQCREAAKKQDYKYVWVKHGVILARKTDNSPVVAIRSLSDIHKIK
ncbi:uncharacterized protein LOC121738757 [Aricia agestis]|uniref:uncharacterized protein LOC121738757 n=1 Tax=Aricia agestis TaxID=91739 RepID=UPI001C20AE23|nr:uncharacterized protein LOC121738757 [Aricia agestis]